MKEQEILDKENERKQKLEKKQKENEKDKEMFFINQKKKLKEQFKEITMTHNEIREHEIQTRNKIHEIDIKKYSQRRKNR